MKRQGAGFVPFVLALMAASWLWEECGDAVEFLFVSTPFNMWKFERLLRTRPQQVVMMAALLVVCVIAVMMFIRMLGGGRKRASVSDAPKRTPVRDAPVRRAPAKRNMPEAEEAIHCAHLTGRAKYLEQIDNYLKTGLIDRNEYRVLKERYMKLDIQDDYH